MTSRLMRSRRALLSCAHRLAFGKSHLENVDVVARGSVPSSRHMWTACEIPREPEMRLWSRASFSRSKFASGYSALTPKTLEQIMKIETVIFATPQEITTIWNDYHIGRGHISAVMGSDLYKLFQQRASDCPLFVLPLRKGNGFISILVQVQLPHMLFTSLDDYRARGTEAAPYFTVTHYTDLAPSKQLVLVRGDIVFTSRLKDEEAETLLKTAHSFYLNDDRYRKVRRFNKESGDFDFKEVLQELNISS